MIPKLRQVGLLSVAVKMLRTAPRRSSHGNVKVIGTELVAPFIYVFNFCRIRPYDATFGFHN